MSLLGARVESHCDNEMSNLKLFINQPIQE